MRRRRDADQLMRSSGAPAISRTGRRPGVISRGTVASPRLSHTSVVTIDLNRLTPEQLHHFHRAVAALVQVVQDEVRIAITDDGGDRTPRKSRIPRQSPAATPGGHGIVGMRERVALYSGVFSAGPCPTGGFAVHATLPYEEHP